MHVWIDRSGRSAVIRPKHAAVEFLLKAFFLIPHKLILPFISILPTACTENGINGVSSSTSSCMKLFDGVTNSTFLSGLIVSNTTDDVSSAFPVSHGSIAVVDHFVSQLPGRFRVEVSLGSVARQISSIRVTNIAVPSLQSTGARGVRVFAATVACDNSIYRRTVSFDSLNGSVRSPQIAQNSTPSIWIELTTVAIAAAAVQNTTTTTVDSTFGLVVPLGGLSQAVLDDRRFTSNANAAAVIDCAACGVGTSGSIAPRSAFTHCPCLAEYVDTFCCVAASISG